MQSLLFVVPFKPGMLDEYKKMIDEATGPRKKEYRDMLGRYGLKSVKVWYQSFSGKEYVIVLHDIEKKDAMERLQAWSSSTYAFDHWFREQLLKYYDIKDFDHLPEQPQAVFSFERES